MRKRSLPGSRINSQHLNSSWPATRHHGMQAQCLPIHIPLFRASFDICLHIREKATVTTQQQQICCVPTTDSSTPTELLQYIMQSAVHYTYTYNHAKWEALEIQSSFRKWARKLINFRKWAQNSWKIAADNPHAQQLMVLNTYPDDTQCAHLKTFCDWK